MVFLVPSAAKPAIINITKGPRGALTPRAGTDTGGLHMSDVITPSEGSVSRSAACRAHILNKLKADGPQTASELRLGTAFTVDQIQQALIRLSLDEIQRTPITPEIVARAKAKGIHHCCTIAFALAGTAPTAKPPRAPKPLAERVARRLEPQENGCLVATKGLDKGGYARIVVQGKHLFLHRVAYELAKGPIPDGLVIDHLCCTPACCNPDHLEAVTDAENRRRVDIRKAERE